MVGLICEHRSRCGLCPAAAVPGVVLHESEILACGVVLAGVTTVGHCRYVLVMLLFRASVEVCVVIGRHGAFVGSDVLVVVSLGGVRENFVSPRNTLPSDTCVTVAMPPCLLNGQYQRECSRQ